MDLNTVEHDEASAEDKGVIAADIVAQGTGPRRYDRLRRRAKRARGRANVRSQALSRRAVSRITTTAKAIRVR